LGAKMLNIELQKVLNPGAVEKIERFGVTFAVGDKVMQIQNNYDKDVFNGDMGFILGISMEDKELIVSFDEKEITYDFDELDELVLAYACTIHKSQGKADVNIGLTHFNFTICVYIHSNYKQRSGMYGGKN